MRRFLIVIAVSLWTTTFLFARGKTFVDITLTFDATGLTGGDYETEIVITSNDPPITGARGNAGAEFDGSSFYSTRWASNLLHEVDMSSNVD